MKRHAFPMLVSRPDADLPPLPAWMGTAGRITLLVMVALFLVWIGMRLEARQTSLLVKASGDALAQSQAEADAYRETAFRLIERERQRQVAGSTVCINAER